MWHHAQFAGGCWDGSTAAAAGVDSPAYPYGCSFGGGGSASSGPYVAGYHDGASPGSAPPPYYGMYGLPSLAAASPWTTGHSPSLGYTAVGTSLRPPPRFADADPCLKSFDQLLTDKARIMVGVGPRQ